MVNQVYSRVEDEPVDSGLVSGPVETTGFPIESVDLLEPRRVEPELLAPIPTSTGWEMVAAVPRLLVRYYSTLRAAYGIRFVFMVLIIYGVGQGEEEILREFTVDFAPNQDGLRDAQKISDFIFSKKEMIEERFGISLTQSPGTKNDEAYEKSNGGTPFLDGAYTVFGKVVEGLEVVDVIATLPTKRNPQTGENSTPLEDIPMTMEVVEMKKKEITEKYGYEYPE